MEQVKTVARGREGDDQWDPTGYCTKADIDFIEEDIGTSDDDLTVRESIFLTDRLVIEIAKAVEELEDAESLEGIASFKDNLKSVSNRLQKLEESKSSGAEVVIAVGQDVYHMPLYGFLSGVIAIIAYIGRMHFKSVKTVGLVHGLLGR